VCRSELAAPVIAGVAGADVPGALSRGACDIPGIAQFLTRTFELADVKVSRAPQ
jgi:hypothetical protein